MKPKKPSLSYMYAQGINAWSQVAIIISIGSAIMNAGTFYAIVASKYIALWIFVTSIFIISAVTIFFVLKWGIPWYYKLQRKLIRTEEIELLITNSNNQREIDKTKSLD